MKHTVLPVIICMLLGGCATSEELEGTHWGGENVPISLSCTWDAIDEATRGIGPINGTGANYNISLFRADHPVSSSTYPSVFQAPAHGQIKGSVIENPFYYLSDPTKKSKLVGLYPEVSASAVSGLNVTYSNIDGSTDILCSDMLEGSKSSTMGTMTFRHMLTKIEVVISCTETAVGKWGAVESVSLVGKQLKNCVVALPVPTTANKPSATGNGDATLLLTTAAGGKPIAVKPEKGTPKFFGCVMFPTNATGLSLHVKIDNQTAPWTPALTIPSFVAGQSYKVHLEFTATAINITTVVINGWGTTGDITQTVPL